MAYTLNMNISDLLSTVRPRLKKMGGHDSMNTSIHIETTCAWSTSNRGQGLTL